MPDRNLLRRAGELLHGHEWQRAIARSLGPHHPDGARESIDDRLVRRWVAGERPVPEWVWPALMQLACAAIAAQGERTGELRRLARMLGAAPP